jgi:hypothetical protein
MVLRFVVDVHTTWPSSGVYDISLFYSWRNLLRCFCCLCCMLLYYAVSNLWGGLNVMYYYLLYLCTLLFCYSIYVFYLLVFVCCVSVNFHILVCVFGFLAFPCCLSGLCWYKKWNIIHTWKWPCRPKHVVWTSTTKRKALYNKAASRRQLILKSYW